MTDRGRPADEGRGCGSQGSSFSRTNTAPGRRVDRGELSGHVAHHFDAPAGNRVQRWRTQGLAGTQAEAGVVPGTSNRIADQKSLLERSPVMGADRTDREHLIATSGQEHRFAASVPEQHGSVGNRRKLNTFREVRSTEFLLFVAHRTSLTLRLLSTQSLEIRALKESAVPPLNHSSTGKPNVSARRGVPKSKRPPDRP